MLRRSAHIGLGVTRSRWRSVPSQTAVSRLRARGSSDSQRREPGCSTRQPLIPADSLTVFVAEASIVGRPSGKRLVQFSGPPTGLWRMHSPLSRQYIQRDHVIKTQRIDVIPRHLGDPATKSCLADLLDQAIYPGPNSRLNLDQHSIRSLRPAAAGPHRHHAARHSRPSPV